MLDAKLIHRLALNAVPADQQKTVRAYCRSIKTIVEQSKSTNADEIHSMAVRALTLDQQETMQLYLCISDALVEAFKAGHRDGHKEGYKYRRDEDKKNGTDLVSKVVANYYGARNADTELAMYVDSNDGRGSVRMKD